jgi:endonuclease G
VKAGKPLVQVALGLLLFVPMTAVVVVGTLTSDKSQTAAARPYDQMPFGNPSGAAEADPDNWLVKHPHFALSWNQSKGTANWVSWRVSREDLGVTDRRSNFVRDLDLPRSLAQPHQVWYEGTGFDLGHVCPHADRGATHEAAYSTFVMTNVMPQAPNLNRVTWEHLEVAVRDLVAKAPGYATAHVAAGPNGEGGVGANGPAKSIRGIVVPESCWKVIRFEPAGTWLAVWMPNRQDVNPDWHAYAVSVAEVEKRTGYRFTP